MNNNYKKNYEYNPHKTKTVILVRCAFLLVNWQPLRTVEADQFVCNKSSENFKKKTMKYKQ